jgi:hypothetical protein
MRKDIADRSREVLFWAALLAWMAGMCALSFGVTVIVTLLDRSASAPVPVSVSVR